MRATGITVQAGLGRPDDSTVHDALRFRVLGPLEAASAGSPVRIGGLRQRIILAMLLIDAGRVVSVHRLAEAVWGDRPPASARTQIAIAVSALRRAFDEAGAREQVIGTAPPGYVLHARPGQLDTDLVDRQVALAEAATATGRHETTAACLRAAVGVWRGQPFADVPSEPVQAAAARLDERRLMLVEEQLRLELALGRDQGLIAELSAYVRQHPFRERLRGQLMVALYRTGRCTEALEWYRDFQRALAEDLGLDPGWQLRDLHQAMLRGEQVLAAAPYVADLAAQPAPATPPGEHPVPVELPSDDPMFVGREAELARLDRLLGEREGSLVVANLTGLGGIGKTSLAVRWAHRVAERFPDGQIFVRLAAHDDGQRPLAATAVLERILRALGVPAESIPDNPEERSALLRTTVQGRRLLLILDDALSAAQVRPLLPGSDGCCVLVTSRGRLHDLAVREGAELLALGPLPAETAAELLSAAIGATRTRGHLPAVNHLAEHCGGLPLALRIAAARLVARPYWTVSSLAARTVDETRRLDELGDGEASVRDALATSYLRLPPRAASLLRRLALLDVDDVAPWLGASLLATGLDETEDTLGVLLDAHLLHFDGTDAAGQPRFRIPTLVRLYARERAALDEPAQALNGVSEAALDACRYLAGAAHRRVGGGARRERQRRVHPPFDAATVDRILHRPLSWLRCEQATLRCLARHAAGAHSGSPVPALARGA